MSNEWFDIAWINFTKAILHGQFVDSSGAEHEIEHVLTEGQREALYDMNERHEREMKALLRSIAASTQSKDTPQ